MIVVATSSLPAAAATDIIVTVAGTGEPGYNGDNIPATTAQLTGPGALAFDGSGNLYMGEGNRIRKVSPLEPPGHHHHRGRHRRVRLQRRRYPRH